MDPFQLEYGDHILRLDGPVIEVFARIVDGSQRTHVNHAVATLTPTRKHDGLKVEVGNGATAGQPLLGDESPIGSSVYRFTVDPAEQGRLEQFFAEAERRRG
jgi:hypothetical protein